MTSAIRACCSARARCGFTQTGRWRRMFWAAMALGAKAWGRPDEAFTRGLNMLALGLNQAELERIVQNAVDVTEKQTVSSVIESAGV